MVSFKSAALSFIVLAGTTSITSAFTVLPPQQHVRAPTRTSRLYMGWGPDPIWSDSKIENFESANGSKECSKVTVAIDPKTAKEYLIPGQYVQVRPNEETKPLFLAITSPPAPESDKFEFLIKITDDNTWISSQQSTAAAETVQVSQVLGGGFPIQKELSSLTDVTNVLLFAAGSGIAPIAAAIESGDLQTADSARTGTLYYGVRTESDLCFVDQFPAWKKAGIEVVPVVSQPSDSWTGKKGYVQNALEEDGVTDATSTGALMCGMKEMAVAVTEVLSKAGVVEGRILTNF